MICVQSSFYVFKILSRNWQRGTKKGHESPPGVDSNRPSPEHILLDRTGWIKCVSWTA